MAALAGRIFERRGDVLGFEKRIIPKDFLAAGAGSEEIKHVLHANAQTAQAGTPAALAGVDGYAVCFSHRGTLELNSFTRRL
jgi:hypothetical protein